MPVAREASKGAGSPLGSVIVPVAVSLVSWPSSCAPLSEDRTQVVTVHRTHEPVADGLAIAQVGPHLSFISLPFREVRHEGDEGVRVRGFPHKAARDRRGSLGKPFLVLYLD
jgi:hypothetical protein